MPVCAHRKLKGAAMAVKYRMMTTDENVRRGDQVSKEGENWSDSVNYLVCKKQSPGYKYRRPIRVESRKPARNKPKLSAAQIAALKRIGLCLLRTPQGRSAIRALLKKCAATSA